jgi:hypothetical protein
VVESTQVYLKHKRSLTGKPSHRIGSAESQRLAAGDLSVISRHTPITTGREAELLLCCARTHLDAKTLERLRFLLRQELDWPYLILTALTHHVLPLLYSSLRASNPEAVPKASLVQLRDHYRANVQHSFFLTAELLKLLKLFETHQINAIPFKGPVLAASVYRDLSLRQFNDLDILVHKPHILKAGRLLVSQGYQSSSTNGDALEHDFDHEEVAFLGPKYYTFCKPDRQIRVDLQWRITESYFSFSLDRKRLWERLVPVSIGGRNVLTFAPTDLLLILCVHGSKHRWEQLKWMCDVAELVRTHKEEIDWENVQQEASRQGAERMLGLGLFLAHELLETALPEKILKKILADGATKSVAQQIRMKLFAQANDLPRDVKKVIFYLRTKDRWQDRLQFCFHYLSQWLRVVVTPTSIEREVLPLPAPFFFLYYFFRPLRLTVKHGWSALTHIHKGSDSAK